MSGRREEEKIKSAWSFLFNGGVTKSLGIGKRGASKRSWRYEGDKR